MLKAPNCKSSFEDMDENTKFKPIIEMIEVNSNTKTVLICTGKFCYDIQNVLKASDKDGKIALVTLEELMPFPE